MVKARFAAGEADLRHALALAIRQARRGPVEAKQREVLAVTHDRSKLAAHTQTSDSFTLASILTMCNSSRYPIFTKERDPRRAGSNVQQGCFY